MNVAAILATINMVGAATPAFKALLDQVLPIFGSEDQEVLKSAYEQARQKSDAAHGSIQDAARDAQD